MLSFTPLQIRGVTLKNRLVVPPMMQYRGEDGYATDWHIVHLGRFALGGFGLVLTEATAIHPLGRVTHADLGVWKDEHIGPLARVTSFLHEQGCMAGIQLNHAGPKASRLPPWRGGGAIGDDERSLSGWQPMGPEAEASSPGYAQPRQLTPADIDDIVYSYAAAAVRADRAGFDVLEIHGAHGYLIASFLSPSTNHRTDCYGGDLAGRMRLALEVARSVRANWPAHKPLFFRVSAVDGMGWTLDDSVVLGRALKQCGVDVVDCSSGGLRNNIGEDLPKPFYQVPYAARIRRQADTATMAVGMLLDLAAAEQILRDGDADLVAIGRQALYDPALPLHALHARDPQRAFEGWNKEAAWFLDRRAKALDACGLASSGHSA